MERHEASWFEKSSFSVSSILEEWVRSIHCFPLVRLRVILDSYTGSTCVAFFLLCQKKTSNSDL